MSAGIIDAWQMKVINKPKDQRVVYPVPKREPLKDCWNVFWFNRNVCHASLFRASRCAWLTWCGRSRLDADVRQGGSDGLA